MSALDSLQALLRTGPHDANAICRALGISQPTFSRLWKQPGAGVIQIGKARASRYALLRPLGDLGAELRLYRIAADGSSGDCGKLALLSGDFTYVDCEGVEAVYEGLPYFLQDLRPQGFLGRAAPRHYPELHLPQDIRLWSDDDVLQWASRRAIDVPGDLIVGTEAYRRFLSNEPLLRFEATRELDYPALARQANLGDLQPGSSAAGEQPKFTTQVMRADGTIEHVIVKFSPPHENASGRRWADLLVAEHLALRTLHDHGITACATQIIMAEGRTFLEAVRFDRHGKDGRSPAITLAALDGMTRAVDKTWTHCAKLLADEGRLQHADVDAIALLDVFGVLIGNDDRHHGNLGFRWHASGTLALAPAYDMLPMLYRPNAQGEIVQRELDLAPLDRLDLRQLPKSRDMACDFWARVDIDERISEGFKQVASNHAAALRSIR